VDEDLSELERFELAKKWWKDNYLAIFSGALLAVLIVGGWRYWQYRVTSRSEAASALFAQLTDAATSKDAATAVKLGDQLMNQYDDTSYATQAAFALAQQDATNGKPDDGTKMLDWVLQHESDNGLKLLARLRLARIRLATGAAQAALDELADVDAGGFAPLYDDLRGDAYVKLGKPDEARAAYQKALSGWTDQLGDHAFVDMKINSLPTKVSK
jgi:predicted negative regulator of RcsB-dependent stress response